ncbi:hypothetical protein PMZ80_003170 [Knufia obscura]|uniref:Uncharacterized protein n=2 Tax=Knufia TaxID=430999 RepID=A0AAN8I1L1_9EURO|nr:hypothetical protein PMZ80_003170 [Knufia obscura]KAK5949292.1 hypothetical protein OHC33_009645 [Knufia fluminis]
MAHQLSTGAGSKSKFPKHTLQRPARSNAQKRKQRKLHQNTTRGLASLDLGQLSSSQKQSGSDQTSDVQTSDSQITLAEEHRQQHEVAFWKARAENAEAQLQAANTRIEELVAEVGRQAERVQAWRDEADRVSLMGLTLYERAQQGS